MFDQQASGQPKTIFKTLADAWTSRCLESPDHPFLIENQQTMSYRQLDQISSSFINFFKHQQIKIKDLVAIQLPASILAVELIVTCFKLQVAVMPLSMNLGAQELQTTLKTMMPKMIILSDTKLADSIATGSPDYEYTPINSGSAEQIFAFKNSMHNDSNKLPEEIAAILMTSGTTGYPKGVMLSAQNIIYSETQFTRVFNITESDKLLLALPLNHAIGFHHGIVSTILTGSTCVLLRQYEPKKCIELIQKNKCTYTLAVPTVVYDLFTHIVRKRFLRQIICGGSPISTQLMRKAKQYQVPVYNVFGTTECVPFVCTSPKYFQEKAELTTAGFPITGMTMKLIDADGRVILKNYQSGQIITRGPVVFKGYFQDRLATEQVLDKDGWFYTGDLGHYNQDGALQVDGRMSDIIMRGGEKISAQTIEEAVLSCSEIQQAAAIGVKDTRLGERIGVCITLMGTKSQVSLDGLKAFLDSQHVLKKYWPEKLFICKSLPMTDSGKIKKRLLKQQIGLS